MHLTRWTFINQDFDQKSRLTKKEWCELIETFVVPGKVIAGTPYIDAARFSGATVMNPPAANDGMDSLDLLG